MRRRLILLATMAPAVSAPALQEEDNAHNAVYARVVDSVVAVRARATLGERSGTGILLDSTGLILTSYSVVPDEATEIRVWLKGPRLYPASLVAASKHDEISLLRIEPDQPLKPIRRGDSSKVEVGDLAYTIGNAANCSINDDQPAFNVGIISGVYTLRIPRQNAYFTGRVFETSAAVNWGMEGGPLLNAEGECIGMITLNFSPHRWLGNAIPLETLGPRIEALLRQTPAQEEDGKAEAGRLGFRLKKEAGRLVFDSVEPGGPAERAGVEVGDILLGVGSRTFQTPEEFAEFAKGVSAGSIVVLRIRKQGDSRVEEVRLEAAK